MAVIAPPVAGGDDAPLSSGSMGMVPDASHRTLIERLETEAAQAPGRYRAKVAMLAVLGFVVLGGAIVLAFGLSAGLVIGLLALSPILLLKLFKIIWVPVAFGGLLLKALWIRFDPPQGHRLVPGEAPLLEAEVEHLRQGAGAPPLSGIVLDADLNAAAASVPRALGLLGHRHYLVLGLPLMQALDRDQFAAVIAHEFGHFGGGHGRFAGWVHRVRISWYRVLEALEARHSWASGAFVRFFNWYAPYFNAYSFALARSQEYQADATAARLAGAEAAGSALMRVDLAAERLAQDFWPQLRRRNRDQVTPPPALYSDMAASLQREEPRDAERLTCALERAPGFSDTHPTLAQRLQALGIRASVPALPVESAAAALLGDLLPLLERRFSEEWRGEVDAAWGDNFQRHAQDRQRLEELDGQDVRTPQEWVEYAHLVESVCDGVDAVPLYRHALAQAPEHPFARFRLGSLLLARGEDAGADHLWRAAELDPQALRPVLEQLETHYRRVCDAQGLARVEARWKQWQAAVKRASAARSTLQRKDAYLPSALDEDALESLQHTLQGLGGIARAWLVRKQIQDDPEGMPHFVLLVKWRGLVLDEDSRLRKVVDAVELPGSVLVFAGKDRAAARKVRAVAGSPVFARH